MLPTSRWPLARLRVLSGREVCRILETRGFDEVRGRGSHVVMRKAATEGAVPVPDHRELRTGTLLSIIRQSGAPRSSKLDSAGGAIGHAVRHATPGDLPRQGGQSGGLATLNALELDSICFPIVCRDDRIAGVP